MSFASLIAHTHFIALLHECYQLGFILYFYVVFLESCLTRYEKAVCMSVWLKSAANRFAALGCVDKCFHFRIQPELVCASQ